jgi:hypothetical protein
VIGIQGTPAAGGSRRGHTPFDELALREEGFRGLYAPLAELPGWQDQDGTEKIFTVYGRR